MKFGTDGIRGLANVEVTPELALAVGRAAARVLGGPLVVGLDTRRSGPMLEAAVVAGAASAGVDVLRLGVTPTPAVAWAAATLGAPGAVVSASHNPWADNGLKLFAAGGRKLDAATEAAVEAALEEAAPTGPVGRAILDLDQSCTWVNSIIDSLQGRRLDGLRVLVDAANGAASAFAGDVFEGVGATVEVRNDTPDGRNINEGCGAAHPEALAAAVVEGGFAVGIALDGDADRCIAVDHLGNVVDGDQILTVLALHREVDTVVVTVMSNLGFRLAMAEQGIAVVETPVGDKHVLDALEAGGHVLGGEQSGHVIQRDLATTGDGLLTALHLCDAVARSGRPLAELAGAMTKLPQVLRNVRVGRRDVDVSAEVAAVEAELGDYGRVLLRPSGTEPLIRVMVEAPTREQAESAAARLAAAVEAAAGPK